MKIYIAGPMRGIPEHNFPLFNFTADRLRQRGHQVINPVDIGEKHFQNDTSKTTQHEFITKDILELLTCDALAVLPGWEKSCGASIEVAIAKVLGFIFYDEFGEMTTIGDVTISQSYGPR